MSVVLNEPKYPVVNPKPSFKETGMSNTLALR
jgi:hypothetical protein